MSDKYTRAAEYVDKIEAELKTMGSWSSTPPPPQAFESQKAFFMDTMPFAHWIQFVLLDRVRSIIAEKGSFPSQSMVGAQAIREFDGEDRAAGLISVLCEFDAFIEDRL